MPIDPFFGSALGGILGMFGGGGGGEDAGPTSASAREAARASDRDIEATREANRIEDRRILEGRDWQEGMRSTAYQASVQDMERAGINPAVHLAGGGSATSAPGTSSGRSHKADPSGASRASSAASMARSASQGARTNVKKLVKEAALAGASVIKTRAETKAVTAAEASAKSTKLHTDAVTEGVNARNVPDKIRADAYTKHPWLAHPAVKAGNPVMKALIGALGIRTGMKSFSKGLRQSWDKAPPKGSGRGRGKWGSNH